VALVVRAVVTEVAQRGELGLDAVGPAGVVRGVGELNVVGSRPLAYPVFVDRWGLKLSSTTAMRTPGGWFFTLMCP